MSAKQCAVRDIFTDLAKSGKCFIAFHRELDKAIDELVNNQIKELHTKTCRKMMLFAFFYCVEITYVVQ